MEPGENSLSVTNNEQEHRYEIALDGGHALLTYELRDDQILFTHTEVPDAYQGQGVGDTLVRAALDDARSRALKVVPLCSFVAAFIRRHTEYQSLVHGESSGAQPL